MRRVQREVQAVIKETAYYEAADSTETLDLYELLLEDGVIIDFWFPKGQRPTSMDLHVEFERGKEG
jgi:hypothetical protein